MAERPPIMSKPVTTWLILATILGTTTMLVGGRLAARHDHSEAIGHHWRSLTSQWGEPNCTARMARLSTRESASRPTARGGGLVIPHLELILEDPAPTSGPSACNSHRTIIWSDDATIQRHTRRVTVGDLRDIGMETRIAVDRSKPVKIVRIDSAGKVIEIDSVRPVFVTVLPR
jgi:hypothetical protein